MKTVVLILIVFLVSQAACNTKVARLTNQEKKDLANLITAAANRIRPDALIEQRTIPFYQEAHEGGIIQGNAHFFNTDMNLPVQNIRIIGPVSIRKIDANSNRVQMRIMLVMGPLGVNSDGVASIETSFSGEVSIYGEVTSTVVAANIIYDLANKNIKLGSLSLAHFNDAWFRWTRRPALFSHTISQEVLKEFAKEVTPILKYSVLDTGTNILDIIVKESPDFLRDIMSKLQ